MDILKTPISGMAGIEFDCACGRRHSLRGIEAIRVGRGALAALPELIAPWGKKVFLFGDQNTRRAAGQRVQELLEGNGFDVKPFFFDSGEDILIPDEKALGRLFMELDASIRVIVAVGSGTLNDLGKYLSARTGIPFAIVCTAPSMDGYASDGSPMICGGFKISFVSTLPRVIVADSDILREAPQRLIQAGVGDVLGKLTALADWRLARERVGEYHCAVCEALVRQALDRVEKNIDGIRRREEEAIGCLTEALILTGVAMGLIGVSRPASGAEHQMSHYWEMDFIARGLFPELHGIKVGVSTPVIAELFGMMEADLPACVREIVPRRERVEALLAAVGAPVTPRELGIGRELFRSCLLDCHSVRKRYSILELAIEKGRLADCAEAITERLYGKEEG